MWNSSSADETVQERREVFKRDEIFRWGSRRAKVHYDLLSHPCTSIACRRYTCRLPFALLFINNAGAHYFLYYVLEQLQ